MEAIHPPKIETQYENLSKTCVIPMVNKNTMTTESKNNVKWVGPRPFTDLFPCWARKKDAPKGAMLKRIEFRFEVVWMEFYGSDILGRAGAKCPTHECWTSDGHFMGFRDRSICDGTPLQNAWRESFKQ